MNLFSSKKGFHFSKRLRIPGISQERAKDEIRMSQGRDGISEGRDQDESRTSWGLTVNEIRLYKEWVLDKIRISQGIDQDEPRTIPRIKDEPRMWKMYLATLARGVKFSYFQLFLKKPLLKLLKNYLKLCKQFHLTKSFHPSLKNLNMCDYVWPNDGFASFIEVGISFTN